jgi:4'-phosphopantetheinyl transferase EntD
VLAQMRRDEGPILKRESGAPLWPAGIVGSITHTDGYGAAVAASAADFAGLGVDAERVGGVTPDLWPRLFNAIERAGLEQLRDPAKAATILFSAKEACHKAGRESVLRFQDLHIVLADDHFTARRGTEAFEGRHGLKDGLVLAIAWRA